MSVLDFDRWDWRATKVFVLFALVAVPISTIGHPVIAWVTGKELRYSIPSWMEWDHAVATCDGVAASIQRCETVVSVGVDQAPVSLWLIALVPPLIVAVAALLVLWPTWRLVSAVSGGDGFGGSAVRWLRMIAFTLIVTPLVYQLAHSVAAAAVLKHVAGPPDSVGVEFSGSLIVVTGLGVVFAVLGEAFRQGRRLRDDVAGLV